MKHIALIAALSCTTAFAIDMVNGNGGGINDPAKFRGKLDLQELYLKKDNLLEKGDLQNPVEKLSSITLVHDDMSGDNATIALAGTRACEPGPGTVTVGSAAGTSAVRYENGEMRMMTYPNGTGGVGIHYGAFTAAPGLTFIATVIPSWTPGAIGSLRMGFFHNGTVGGSRRGIVNLTAESPYTGVSKILVSALAADPDDAEYLAHRGSFNPGELLRVAVTYKTLSHQQYYIQGGSYAELGCTVGSDNWFLIGETFLPISGTVYPGVSNQFYGVGVVKDAQVLSTWSPSSRCKTFDYSRTQLGIHIPSFGKDPVTSRIILGWNKGTSHVGSGMSAIRYSVKLNNGTWTDAADLIPAPSSPNGASICSFSAVNGALRVVYWKSSSGGDGGTLYWRTVSINATTGVATLGTETLMAGITGTNLNFSPIITLPSGRLMMPYHKSSDYKSYVAVSDDNGATWIESIMTASLPAGMGWSVEPTMRVETDGAVGCYFRTSGTERVAYYSRCANPAASPPVWSTPVPLNSIPQPGNNGSRMQALTMADGTGLLIGYDNKTTRRKITIWEVGNNGAVFGKIPIADTNALYQVSAGAGIMQYPAIFEDGEDLLIAYSDQPSGGVELTCQIRLLKWKWAKPVSIQVGGTGVRGNPRKPIMRQPSSACILSYSTSPTPDMATGNRFYLGLTASTATIGAPLNPQPWETLVLYLTQAGSGSYTVAWNSVYEFNGSAPTLPTAVGATKVLRFEYNAITSKWVQSN